MISVEEAIDIVKKNSTNTNTYTVKQLEKANGYILAEDIYAPINLPPFRQSAMDGYGLHIGDTKTYTIVGEIKAGDRVKIELKKGEAIKILTGAPVPDSIDTIIQKEKTTVSGNIVEINDQIDYHKNIRLEGEQIKTNEIALKKHTKITPAVVGFLYALGIDKVTVFKKPSVGIIVTGNELIQSGQPLNYGEIYESNSKMLLSALYNLKFYDVSTYYCKDNYDDTVTSIKSTFEKHDIVLISGGISVGKYDFVYRALQELGVNELFYKVNQKPGKPVFYGKKSATQIFGLPGNPAATLTCFYIYVYIALQNFSGNHNIELIRKQITSISKHTKPLHRSEFLKAKVNDANVEILTGQSSAMLQSFAVSNAIVYLSENQKEIHVNDVVETILLPF